MIQMANHVREERRGCCRKIGIENVGVEARLTRKAETTRCGWLAARMAYEHMHARDATALTANAQKSSSGPGKSRREDICPSIGLEIEDLDCTTTSRKVTPPLQKKRRSPFGHG